MPHSRGCPAFVVSSTELLILIMVSALSVGHLREISRILFGSTPILNMIIRLNILDSLRMSVSYDIRDGPVRILSRNSAVVSRFSRIQTGL